MEALIISALRAIRSLVAPGMLRVFILSIIVTIAALTAFIIFASMFFTWLGAHLQGHAIAAFLPWIGGIGSGIIAWLLFPGIMPVIISFFDERIAAIIERHDYPAAAPARTPEFLTELLHDLRFSAWVIFLNILVLPLYLLPLINLILFYGLNGHLLGREFFVMAARRHMSVEAAEALRKQHSRTVLTAGVALAVMATIPILNLFAPFWGVAVMVHLYHRLAKTPDSQLLPPHQA